MRTKIMMVTLASILTMVAMPSASREMRPLSSTEPILVESLDMLISPMVDLPSEVPYWVARADPLIGPLEIPVVVRRPATALELRELRIRKCEHIVKTFYDHEGRTAFLPHVEYFIRCHEGMEEDAVARGRTAAEGFRNTWYWSLVYGAANFSLRCYATAPGNCCGPMDVKHYPLAIEPEANIRHHCSEMLGFYVRGVRGIDLCKHVFYPARPHDWGGGRFRKTDAKHRACLAKGYAAGKLGLPEGVYYAGDDGS